MCLWGSVDPVPERYQQDQLCGLSGQNELHDEYHSGDSLHQADQRDATDEAQRQA